MDRIGRDRLILCRCNSPDAAKAGAELGITMYQGRMIDTQVAAAAAPAKPGPAAAPAKPGPAVKPAAAVAKPAAAQPA